MHVYNINQGYNAEMLGKCETLNGYSVLVSKIWECRETMGLEAAMEAAVRHCIANDILRSYLEANSSEVMNMLITEWNLEEAQRAWLAQGKAEGRAQGKAEAESKILGLFKQGYTVEEVERMLAQSGAGNAEIPAGNR